MSILNIISKRFVRIAYSGNALNFEQCNFFGSKFGKLIKDDVTSSFLLPLNSEMGRVEYEKKNGVLNLYNTEVPEHYRNQGIGEILAREVFDYCVERNLKIKLSCDFLKKFYDNHPLPQYKNLVVG